MPAGSGAVLVHRQLSALPGYQVVTYPARWEWMPWRLRRYRRPDAALIHTAPDHAVFLCQPGTAPAVLTFHNYVLDAWMRPFSTWRQRLHYRTDLRWFVRAALRRASRLTAVSQFTADLVRRDLGCDQPIEVIPNGIDTERFTPAPRPPSGRRLRVLFSGNWSRRKGAQWLPAIAAGVGDAAQIVCAVGLRGARAPRAVPGVEFLGRVPYEDMPALYRSVDCLLMPTVREGMSLAVLEAMAAGLPVVASDCASLPELIHPGRGGLLCPVGDTAAFVQALRNLAADAGLRRAMGEYNRARVEQHYTLARMRAAYQALFATVLAQTRGGADGV